ncbi:MAG: HAMP domain-containing sensor histidine kinase [Lapillicoccus sp.]
MRIALLAVSVAVLTSVAGIVISVNLLQRASEQTARSALVALADQAEATAQVGLSPEAAQARVRKALQSINVQIAVVRNRATGGPTLVGDALAVRSLTDDQTERLAAGESLSLRLPRDDGIVLVEARPTPVGGIVLAQRRGDALALGGQALRQLTISLIVTGVIAIVLALLVAWRLSRPLKRTAAAATAMAHGSRDVAIPEEGPREVAEVAASVNRLAGALSHSEARQREFLLSVSHDLRTPLTAITGYAESLADGLVSSDRLPAVGTVIGDEAKRLERLVADLLDLARLDATEMRMDSAPVDLRGIVDSAAEIWRHRCASAGVDFRVDAAEPAVVVFGDAQRLRQALDGLLENALRVTPQGAPIVVATRVEPGGVAVVEVRDGGPGLSDEDLPVAFERSALYERYRGVRQVGTGLGLAIVHRIVERLGGTVEAGHAREGGARFTIRMRQLTPETPNSDVATQPLPAHTGEPPVPTRTPT